MFDFVTSLATPRDLLGLPKSADFLAVFFALLSVKDSDAAAAPDGFCSGGGGGIPLEILLLGVVRALVAYCVVVVARSPSFGRAMTGVESVASPNTAPSLSDMGCTIPRHQSAALPVGAT